MIYTKKLDILLNAILAVDVKRVMAEKVYILSLGKDYTEKQLKDYIKVRTNFLQGLKDSSITNVDSVYTSITDKTVADKIINNEQYLISEKDDFNELAKIILYKFVTTK